MNYINYINQLWRVVDENPLPSSEVALYVYLLNECNVRYWKMPFPCTSAKICESLHLSKQTLNTARQHLAQVGLISFTKGLSRYLPSKYSILELTDDLTDELTDSLTPIYRKDKDKNQNVPQRDRFLGIPTFDEVDNYMNEYALQNHIAMKGGLARLFCDHYQAVGWKIGSNPITDWQAVVRNWLNEPRNLNLTKDDSNKTNVTSFRDNNRTNAQSYAEQLEQRALLAAGAA